MRWTKQHIKNAVAAKARLRMKRANAEWPDEPKYVDPKLGRFVPDFTINIRTKNGERCQITATRFGKQMLTGDGIKSVREISRGIEVLLKNLSL